MNLKQFDVLIEQLGVVLRTFIVEGFPGATKNEVVKAIDLLAEWLREEYRMNEDERMVLLDCKNGLTDFLNEIDARKADFVGARADFKEELEILCDGLKELEGSAVAATRSFKLLEKFAR